MRSLARAARVLVPVLAALVLDVAILLAAGIRLSLFNLVALLLVVGIGLNYALFFNRPAPDRGGAQRTLLSLAVCCATTLSAFGCLAFSQTPVLRAIGITVALGTVLSLVMSRGAVGESPLTTDELATAPGSASRAAVLRRRHAAGSCGATIARSRSRPP